MKVLQPTEWPPPKGYSNGIAAKGTFITIAGQIGWNEREELVSDDFTQQTEQALLNIHAILSEANASPEHLVRLTWYVTDKEEYKRNSQSVGEAYRRIMGRHYPAMSLVQVSALLEERAKVEIEATAVIPD